ncbi:hypothetical protein CVIRNUC_006171 [Coccomyxa viridis]|uniref:Uncharacterized protein n=1 Tax=Coccomyxa viridis TaxID=1274662 RepID=A0AAV1I8A4_9CHLO|nr:hypothetical protein CVIRNUC_006171 [Coccomyxa viridis]
MDITSTSQHALLVPLGPLRCSCRSSLQSRPIGRRPAPFRSASRQLIHCVQQSVPHTTPHPQHQITPPRLDGSCSHQARTASRTEQGSGGGSVILGAASACAVGALLLLVGGAARADEEGFSQGPDVLTSVLFTLTAVALGVLSLGVVYLSATSFLDKRTENEARKKFDAAAKTRELQEATAGKVKVKRRRPDELSRGGGKGFG